MPNRFLHFSYSPKTFSWGQSRRRSSSASLPPLEGTGPHHLDHLWAQGAVRGSAHLGDHIVNRPSWTAAPSRPLLSGRRSPGLDFGDACSSVRQVDRSSGCTELSTTNVLLNRHQPFDGSL